MMKLFSILANAAYPCLTVCSSSVVDHKEWVIVAVSFYETWSKMVFANKVKFAIRLPPQWKK